MSRKASLARLGYENIIELTIRERERERERQTETDRDRQRQTDRERATYNDEEHDIGQEDRKIKRQLSRKRFWLFKRNLQHVKQT